ncbi:MAG: hypothetical protein DI630_29695 [Gordonia sp. (in: high G+C Gram-positive bacteria)]|nr:MAG: hypothetical protein DI630_29695 [Gordonia sp. (in: high G+C Gram-positive bacteria)]
MAATKRPVHEHSSPVDVSAYTDTDIARFFGALGVPADKVDALIAERRAENRPPPTVSDPASPR